MIRHAPRSVILPVNPFLQACSIIREHHGPGFTFPSSSLWWACTYSQLTDSLKFSFAFILFFLRLGLLALAHYAITIPKRLAIARGIFHFSSDCL